MLSLNKNILEVMYSGLSTGRESSDRVLVTILEGMLSGDYKPGDRVNARKLAETLNVSIVPVREAIHILAGEGVIELSKNRGARIRKLDKNEVSKWWEIIGTMSKLGIKQAAERIGNHEGNIDKVHQAMQLIRDSAGKVEPFEFMMVLMNYHQQIHIVAENEQLNEAWRRLQVVFWAYFFPEFVPIADYWDVYVRNHQRVTDAIISSDSAGAEAIYQYHIDWTVAFFRGERPETVKP
jgi:DNA-binding GntR family transcriptional regulator